MDVYNHIYIFIHLQIERFSLFLTRNFDQQVRLREKVFEFNRIGAIHFNSGYVTG